MWQTYVRRGAKYDAWATYNQVHEEHFFSLELVSLTEIWGQFHQHSTRSFYVRKFHTQFSCAYI